MFTSRKECLTNSNEQCFHPQKLHISADAKTHNQCSQWAVVTYPKTFVFTIIFPS